MLNQVVPWKIIQSNTHQSENVQYFTFCIRYVVVFERINVREINFIGTVCSSPIFFHMESKSLSPWFLFSMRQEENSLEFSPTQFSRSRSRIQLISSEFPSIHHSSVGKQNILTSSLYLNESQLKGVYSSGQGSKSELYNLNLMVQIFQLRSSITIEEPDPQIYAK